MKMNEAFPSKYLKSDSDVPEDGFLTVTISEGKIETMGQGKDAEDKMVLYFEETEKGLVLNKTNWGLIAKIVGDDDTDTWIGRKINLYSTDVQFGQEMIRGIRVSSKPPKSGAKIGNGAPVKAATVPPSDEETDKGIPF